MKASFEEINEGTNEVIDKEQMKENVSDKVDEPDIFVQNYWF